MCSSGRVRLLFSNGYYFVARSSTFAVSCKEYARAETPSILHVEAHVVLAHDLPTEIKATPSAKWTFGSREKEEPPKRCHVGRYGRVTQSNDCHFNIKSEKYSVTSTLSLSLQVRNSIDNSFLFQTAIDPSCWYHEMYIPKND